MGYSDAELQAGLARSAASARRFGGTIESAFRSTASRMRNIFGGAAGFLGIGVGVAGIKSMIDDADRVGDLAKQLNVSAEAVQRIGLMAKLSGSDVDTVVKAFNKLNLALGKQEGRQALKELGISLSVFKNLEVDQQVIMLADAFQRAQEKGKGLTQMSALMGKGYAELLPLLRSNRAELKAIADTDVVSNEDIAELQIVNDELDMMTHAAGKWLKTMAAGIPEGLKMTRDFMIGDPTGEMGPIDFAVSEKNRRLDEKLKKLNDAAAAKKHKPDDAPIEQTAAQRKKESDQQREAALQQAQLQILREQAAGHDKKAEAMERALKIAQQTHDLMEKTGLSEGDAQKVVKERMGLEDKLKARKDKPGHIGPVHKDPKFDNRFRGLDAMHLNEHGDFMAKHLKTPGLDRQKALQNRAISAFGTPATRQTTEEKRADEASKDMKELLDVMRNIETNTEELKDL
jgi:hypothetical protein